MITASQHGSCTSYHWNCKFISGLVCSILCIKQDISIHITRKMHICKMCISWLCYVNWNICISPCWSNLDSRGDIANVLQTVQNRCFQKTRFYTNDVNNKETNENNDQNSRRQFTRLHTKRVRQKITLTLIVRLK
jgi:hypothetical protein